MRQGRLLLGAHLALVFPEVVLEQSKQCPCSDVVGCFVCPGVAGHEDHAGLRFLCGFDSFRAHQLPLFSALAHRGCPYW